MVVSACQQVCISSHCDGGLESDEPLRLLAPGSAGFPAVAAFYILAFEKKNKKVRL